MNARAREGATTNIDYNVQYPVIRSTIVQQVNSNPWYKVLDPHEGEILSVMGPKVWDHHIG